MPHFEPQNDSPPTAIDLFAGCGGATEGMMHAGFQVSAAWEIAAPAHYTYYLRHSEPNPFLTTYRDATETSLQGVPDDLDLLFSGAPCQGVSSAGGTIDPDDPRNDLLFTTIDWVEATDPRLVIIENVVGLRDRHGDLHDALVDELADAGDGYTVQTLALDAADYGVAQHRERLFIVGVRNDQPQPTTWTPARTHTGPQRRLGEDLPEYRTAADVLEELPDPLLPQRPHEDPVHLSIDDGVPYRFETSDRWRVDPHSCGKPIERDGTDVWMPTNHVATDHALETRQTLAEKPHGHSGTSTTDRRLQPGEPAPTMTVSSGTGPVHYQGATPGEGGDIEEVRRITVREAARIQSFDDAYTFAGNRQEQFEQVANAVPPLLTLSVAGHFRQEVLETQPAVA